MKSPWKTIKALDPTLDYLVLASSIPPKSVASTGRLFRGSRVVRKQLMSTDGVMGFSMLAEPLRKHYATLSVWRDEVALDGFVGARPHGELVTSLVAEMDATKFVRWTISGADGHPTWRQALERLG